MKIQVTKDKTVEWSPFGGGSATDVVGVELGADDPRGCPAVRVRKERGGFRVVAVGFVPEPPKEGGWTLPAAFRAPGAALALNGGSVRQSMVEDDGAKAIGRVESPAAEGGKVRVEAYPFRGIRLDCEMDERQVSETAKLLPEGRRPTAVSIQPAAVSPVAALSYGSGRAAKGTLLAAYAGRSAIHEVGIRNGRLAMFLSCADSCGANDLRRFAAEASGVDEQTSEELLAQGVLQPGAAYQRRVAGAVHQIGLARDYLARDGVEAVKSVSLCGFGGATGYVAGLVGAASSLACPATEVFAGATIDGKAEETGLTAGVASHAFLAAYGAAVAALSGGNALHVNFLRDEQRVSSSPIRWRIIAPLLACVLLLSMVGWWVYLWACTHVTSGELNAEQQVRAGLSAAHSEAQTLLAETKVSETHLKELESFAAARHTYGALLAHLAESVPADIQLLTMVLGEPEAQTAGPTPFAATPAPGAAAVAAPPERVADRPTIRLTGLAPKEDKVVGLMDALAEADFGGELIIDRNAKEPKDRSPIIHSFRQSDGAGAGRAIWRNASMMTRWQPDDLTAVRLLSFDVEFKLKERRFK